MSDQTLFRIESEPYSCEHIKHEACALYDVVDKINS